MTQNVAKSNGATLGRRIQIARKDAGYTVRRLADTLGVDPRTVARWQSDDSDPSIETLGQIARVLGKSPAFFLEERV